MCRLRSFSRKLAMALMAQVALCVAAAPMISAQGLASPCAVATSNSGAPTAPAPEESRPSLIAFDAANVRPEEVSDAREKKTRGGRGVQRSTPWGGGHIALRRCEATSDCRGARPIQSCIPPARSGSRLPASQRGLADDAVVSRSSAARSTTPDTVDVHAASRAAETNKKGPRCGPCLRQIHPIDAARFDSHELSLESPPGLIVSPAHPFLPAVRPTGPPSASIMV